MDFNQGILHLWFNFGDSMEWWMSYGVGELKMG